MTAAIWLTLAIVATVGFVTLVVWWGRTTGPSTANETEPTSPPAGPGAEGMNVIDSGEIAPGPDEER